MYLFFFSFCVETGAADQLSATSGTVFLVAIVMVNTAWHYIAVGTSEPAWKMEAFGVKRCGLKGLPVRIFN